MVYFRLYIDCISQPLLVAICGHYSSMRTQINKCNYSSPLMFSSLLPKPKHTNHETLKIVLPKPQTKKSEALIVQSKQFELEPKTISELELYKPLDYTKSALQKSGALANAQIAYEDTIPLKTKYPNLKHHFPRYSLENCPDSSLKDSVDATREVIEKLLAQEQGTEIEVAQDEIVSYIPPSLENHEEQRGRTVQVTTHQEDPMLPPKHKLRKNRHKDPSPPPPLLKKGTTERITKEVKDKWAIPSVVSNWSNNKGFSISLRKRQEAASGGTVAENSSINIEKFSLLALALDDADRRAREELKVRNEERRLQAQAEQKEKERRFEELVSKKRNERQQLKRPGDNSDEFRSYKKRSA